MKLKMFSHDRVEGGKEEWLTPPVILKTFGPFDLDPCAPAHRPWPMATHHYTAEDNGLIKPWTGLVFCNPPYGPKTGKWLARCAEHNNCIALVFARTDTAAFQKFVFPKAASFFFFSKRLSFYHVDGRGGGNAGAPSVLIAYGPHADTRLRGNGTIAGHYVKNQPNGFIGL
jgi:DNA N-6-adenine-methyltransferase (Dam)